MFCNNCGSQIPNGQTVCPKCGANCGQPSPSPYQPQAQQQVIVNSSQQQSNGCATAGFVLSLIGFFISFTFILQLLGLIFSIVGLAKASKLNGTGRGLAITGLIFAILDFIPGVLLIMVLTGAFAAAGSAGVFAVLPAAIL